MRARDWSASPGPFCAPERINVIGALWEVSDDSTPRLMDALYQGLQKGQAPSAALRNAKLSLLRSRSRFSAPFYWAPFQIYTRR
jgi:CHAT domain-containing protein